MDHDKIKVLIVDDHRIVRQGIHSLLEDCQWIEVVGESPDGSDMMRMIRHYPVDVVLLDINLPGASGIDLLRKLKSQQETSHIKVIILSMFTQEEYIIDAIKAGAKGYLPKNTSRNELLEAIRAVSDGQEYFSPLISSILMKTIIKKKQEELVCDKPEDMLSQREIEILILVAQGLSNAEIAEKLFISIRTVESHKNHILQKLGLRNSVDMVKYAIKHRLIDL